MEYQLYCRIGCPSRPGQALGAVATKLPYYFVGDAPAVATAGSLRQRAYPALVLRFWRETRLG